MIQVVIDRDRGMQSFFTRVQDRDLFLEEKRAGKPENQVGVCYWTGGFDRIWTTPDLLTDQELTQSHACRPTKRLLRVDGRTRCAGGVSSDIRN